LNNVGAGCYNGCSDGGPTEGRRPQAAVSAQEATVRGRRRRPAAEGVESVQIKISARHGHLGDTTQDFIREKAQKLTRLFERLTIIEVTVDLKNEGQTWVEFLVKSEHKHDFVSHESHPDLLAAVDLALAKLEMQVRRHKERIQDRRRTPSAGEVAEAPPAADTGEQ
jgi:putative sigma-54 modulation protein